MNNFNFTLQTTEALQANIAAQNSFFSELEAWGHLGLATEILELMNQDQVKSFKVGHVSSDYEGGFDLMLQDIVFSVPKTPEEELAYKKWDLATPLKKISHEISGRVSIALDPESYEKKVFENNIPNIMSHICTPKIYELWQVLETKNSLLQQISPVKDSATKNDFKI